MLTLQVHSTKRECPTKMQILQFFFVLQKNYSTKTVNTRKKKKKNSNQKAFFFF